MALTAADAFQDALWNGGEHTDVDLETLAKRTTRSPYMRWVKPALERSLAACALVALLPVMGGIALLIRLSLGKPVMIKQQRAGLHGRSFAMYKFRTMHPDRRCATRPVAIERRTCHKRADDPRHTPLGRRLRGSGLDELPQLLNVVKGDMALVGPRPELVDIVRRYEPWQHARHLVRPGLTGPWQISGRSSGELMHCHTDVDIRFVREASFTTDVRILRETVHMILAGELRGE